MAKTSPPLRGPSVPGDPGGKSFGTGSELRPDPEPARPRLLNLGRYLFQAAYFLAGSASIFIFAYLFGHGMLEGILGGNDTTWALSLVHWFNQWFPHLPIWYPLQGGGTPLLVFYPPMTSLLSVVVHRLAGVSEAQALSLIGFLSVPITAIGIYLLVWTKVRSQTAGLIAGLLYPLSAASWYWLTQMGMYAQAVSLMFFPTAFLLHDAYIARSVRRETAARDTVGRLVLLAAAIFFAFTLLTHSATGFVLAMAIALDAVVTSVLAGRKTLIRSLASSLKAAAVGIASGIGLAAFWFVPFLAVIRLANREGLTEFAAHQIPYTNLRAIIGLGDPSPSVFSAGLTFALPVFVLAGMGLIAAALRKSQALSWGVLAVFFAVYTSMPGIWPDLVRVFENLWAFTQARAMVPAIVLMPALAGFGVWSVARAVVWLPRRALGYLSSHVIPLASIEPATKAMSAGLTAVIAVALGAAAVISLEGKPANGHQFSGYGPPGVPAGLPIRLVEGRPSLVHPPSYSLGAYADPGTHDLAALVDAHLALDSFVRLDVSPNLGGLTQALGLYSPAYNLTTYNYQSSIIHAMWGYQQGLFYGKREADPSEIDELAGWFGIQYVVLHREQDDLAKFNPDRWVTVYPTDSNAQEVMEIRQYLDAPPLASLLHTPTVLVIGGYQNAIYEQAFRSFIKGGMGFDEVLTVEGKHNIDDYSLDELADFDVILLHGYSYRNRERAWNLLEQFVAAGGGLFVDTGWQYWTPDWEILESPKVLPVPALAWMNLNIADGFTYDGARLIGEQDPRLFSPMIWDSRPWGVSAPSGGLRDWAQPVLTYGSTTLIAAGQFGNGRVVWSGMNLIGHADTYDNRAERELLGTLVRWLGAHPQRGGLPSLEIQRQHPDHIQIRLSQPVVARASLLWREAYSPDWQASVLIEGRRVKVRIDRAGPGMMLLRLPEIPSPGAVIQMDYSLGWRGWAGLGASAVTLVGLVLGALFPGALPSLNLARLKSRSRAARRGSVEWMPDPVNQVPLQSSIDSDQAGDSITAWGQESYPKEPPWELDGEIAGASDIEGLWGQFTSSRKPPDHEADQVEGLIRWWRRTRPRDPERPASRGSSDP